MGIRRVCEQIPAASCPACLAGYLLAAALFVWWVSQALKINFNPVFPKVIKSDWAPADAIQPGSNLGFLNLSSLRAGDA